jgi:hypothetical protein
MGVLTSAGEDEACSIAISQIWAYMHMLAQLVVTYTLSSTNAQAPPSWPLHQSSLTGI